MHNHTVRMVSQENLPAGQRWAMVECDGRMTLFLAEDAVCPAVLEEAWHAYRLLTEPAIPHQRVTLRAV